MSHGSSRLTLVQIEDQVPHLAIRLDRSEQVLVGRGAAGDLAEIVEQGAQLALPEGSAELGVALMRKIEVTDIHLWIQELPHPREVADHVTGRREEGRRQEVQSARLRELHNRSWQMADIALVEGVAADDLDLVAAAVDPDWEHSAGVDDLARRVHRQVTRHGAPALLLEPPPCDPEIEIVVAPERPVDDVAASAHPFSGQGSTRMLSKSCFRVRRCIPSQSARKRYRNRLI